MRDNQTAPDLLTFRTQSWRIRMQRRAILASVYSKQDVYLEKESLRAYLAEYSGIARFHENFHSLKGVSVRRMREKERRGREVLSPKGARNSLLRSFALTHPRSPARSLFRLRARGPFNFTLPSSGLDLIALSYSHTTVTYSCDRTEKRPTWRYSGLVGEKKARKNESSFVPSTRFVSRDGKRTLSRLREFARVQLLQQNIFRWDRHILITLY